MSSSDRPTVPEIITTDLSSSAAVHERSDAASLLQTTNAGDFLSPTTHLVPRSAADSSSPASSLYPPTPGASSREGSILVPPSPTSTIRTVHFPTSMALRDNHPDAKSGINSLGLLGADGRSVGHSRKGSVATFCSEGSQEGTDPDPHGSLVHTLAVPSSPSALSPTTTAFHNDEKDAQPAGKGETTSHASQRPPPGVSVENDTTDARPFAFKPLQLAALLDPKNIDALSELGGPDRLIEGLGTDAHRGLTAEALQDGDDAAQRSEKIARGGAYCATLRDRKRVFGENVLPSRPAKSLLLLMWLALKDKILILLSVAAVISLALGLFQDFAPGARPTFTCGAQGQQCKVPPVDWVEGLAIIIAIVIVVLVGSLNDWQKERQFKVLNEKKEDRTVKVIRRGKETVVNIKDVLVGDVAVLEPGEIVPCDGIFLRGHNVHCDESGATGETHAIKKASFDVCMSHKDCIDKQDCFLLSGAKVLEGTGTYVIVAVGTKSTYGRLMMALQGDTENTPLQTKLNALAELIAKLGSAAGIFLFTVAMIKFFVQLGTDPDRSASVKANNFVQILIISVTLVVVAVPEGLPLAVTLALAFATKRMTKHNLLVRVLSSCEIMANANVICTDKTGTLTQNKMTVVAGSIGIHAKFVRHLSENEARTNAPDAHRAAEAARGDANPDGRDAGGEENHTPTITVTAAPEDSEQQQLEKKHKDDFSVDLTDLNQTLSPSLRRLLNEAIAINSTAFEDKDPVSGEVDFVGSKTEGALLRFAKDLEWDNYEVVREAAETVHVIPFSSERKSMGVVVKLSDTKYRLFLKGASEILTKRCSTHVVVRRRSPDDPDYKESEDGAVETSVISELGKDNISRTIIFYANQMLRTIALCYRDFQSWPPAGCETSEDGDEVPYSELAQDLTLIGITGIEDPLRLGVRHAVAECRRAGVQVKMCTGDNVLTARSIASQCGIFSSGGIIMEGPVFRTLSPQDMDEIIPRLQVLARSSPEDKKILVEALKRQGEIVAVTGDGTNDGPALKTANVGFSMGIAGTEVAKEASDIILMDDNFSSIVSAIMWGRCVNDAVRKFLQFQVSVNITAVIVTFITAVASGSESSVLSAVQLLWINIIMDTFAALALATDPASPELLDRLPDRKSAPLFSTDMRKQIIGQSIYSTAVVLIFHFAGHQIWGFHATEADGTLMRTQDLQIQTFVFNAFVFVQIFNSINCRGLDSKLNIFTGIWKNYYFITITLIEIAVQILIVFVGSSAFQVTRMSGLQWGVSIALGLGALPVGALMRMVPNKPVERMLVRLRLMEDPDALPTVQENWNSAIERVRDNLNTFKNIRGGRARGSSFVMKTSSAQLEKNNIQLPSLLAMVPTLIATTVGAGWTPKSGSLSDPAGQDPSRSSAALWEGKVQFHPDTPANDATFLKWGGSTSRG